MEYDTPAQRKLVYEALLAEIDAGNSFFLCNHIIMLTDCPDIQNFPELWQQKPYKGYSETGYKLYPWFELSADGMQLRREVLLKAIELCQNQH